MSGASSLLNLVLAHPDDDGPRLVYADWCDERSDPRGEFIRLQVALGRLPAGDPARPDLVRRERELIRRHATEWARPFAGIAGRCAFRRGFVGGVTLTAAAFLEHAEAVFAAAPVRWVRLTDVVAVVDRLLASAAIARIVELDLTGNDLGDLGVERLMRSPHVAGLRGLSLGINGLTNRSAQALAAGKPSGLRSLDLSHNHVSEPAGLAGLDQLDLSYNDVSADGLAGLLGRQPPARLRVAGNPIGDAGATLLFDHSPLSATVDLADCGLTAAAVRSLVASPFRERLHSLTLAGNAVGDVGVTGLAEADLDRLRRLSLAGNGVTDAGVQSLAASQLFARLERLDLRKNQLSPEGVELLWASERRNPRLVLDLADNVPPPPDEIDPDDDSPIRVDWTDDD